MWFKRKPALAPELRELVQFLRENGVTEYESAGVKLSIAQTHLIQEQVEPRTRDEEDKPTKGRLLESPKMRKRLGLA